MKYRSILFLLVFFIIVGIFWVLSSWVISENSNNREYLLKINSLNSVILTDRVEETANFYKVNFSFIDDKNNTNNKLITLVNNNFRLIIKNDSLKTNKLYTEIYLEVKNINNIYKKLKDKIIILKPLSNNSNKNYEFVCEDNLGNKITVIEIKD